MPISSLAVNSALQTEDVESLLALGAPNNEYVFEAEQITKALDVLGDGQLTTTNIVAIISLVWAKSFNCSALDIEQRMPAFQRIAQKLVS